MKNKLFKLTALLMAVVGLASCQKDVDVFGISEELAKDKNMLGAYAFTVVDSATMQVVKKEYNLTKEADGTRKGYYRESEVSQTAPTDDKTTPITWDAVMAEDRLSMLVTVTLQNGTVHELTWSENQLHQKGKTFIKNSSSEIEAQNTSYAELANTEFVASSSLYYDHKDTVRYLGWVQKNYNRNGVAPTDTASTAATLRASLEPYMDTITWYMRYKSVTHTIGDAYLDTVIAGEDTSYVAVNVVKVNPSPNSRGNHMISYLVKTDTLQWNLEQVNDRPKESVNSTMVFNQTGDTKTGNYSYRYQTWTQEYYTDPTSPKAIATDSTSTMVASAWALTRVTSVKKFDVLMKGKANGGTEDSFMTISISGFDKKKGEATVGDLKYTLKK